MVAKGRVTITVSGPSDSAERLKLIEQLTREKNYKLIEIDNNLLIFEIGKNVDESGDSSEPIRLED